MLRRSRSNPSSRVTRGVQPRTSLVSRWSNQCAVPSCSARNRVSGGTPGRRASRQPASTTEPAARATGSGTRPRGPGTPAAAQTRRRISATGRGSPLVTTSASPVHRTADIDRGDDRVHRVVDVGGVDQRGAAADQRQPAGPGPVDDRLRSAGCPPVPRSGAAGGTARPGPGCRRPARAVRRWPWTGSSCCARPPGRPAAAAGADQRGPGMRDRRRRDVDQPADARPHRQAATTDRVPSTFARW